MEGAVESALDTGFVAGQDGERVGVTDVAEVDGGDAVEPRYQSKGWLGRGGGRVLGSGWW